MSTLKTATSWVREAKIEDKIHKYNTYIQMNEIGCLTKEVCVVGVKDGNGTYEKKTMVQNF